MDELRQAEADLKAAESALKMFEADQAARLKSAERLLAASRKRQDAARKKTQKAIDRYEASHGKYTP
jgi:hypothetical protein